MALCDICAKIPWEDLPTIPDNLSRGLTGHTYFQPLYGYPDSARGHSYHQSFGALSQSVASCDLCGLIYQSCQKVQKSLEEVKPQWEAGVSREYPFPTWEMWLVKRPTGGDGCWVMSFVNYASRKTKTEGSGEAWIVAALGICVPAGDPLDSVILGRPVEAYGGGAHTIKKAQEWLKDCNEHHACSPGDTELPSRVIDVGENGQSAKVHLWEPVPKGKMGKYVSLSYCWGDTPEFTTTTTTLEERKRGITISSMPLTYQNTINLTRELGVRYLWIDSLCICQDDGEDWERESAKMLSIYSNAYITVAASAGKNSSEGLFNVRPDKEYVPLRYSRDGIEGTALVFDLPLREELINQDYIEKPSEPLSTRAWGLQERALSHRLLLYGTDQLSYECHEGFRAENGLTLSHRHFNVHGARDIERPRYPKNALSDTSESAGKYETLAEWYDLLWHYGPRKLSRASDKLPALSGLARIFAERIGEDYLAGLWRGHLIEGLMWQSLSFTRVQEYRAPSWSWASGDGTPATHAPETYESIAEVLEAHVTLKGLDPFGEVSDGFIKIRAHMDQLFLVLDDWDPEKPGLAYEKNVKVRTKKGAQDGSHSRFDFAFTRKDAPKEAKKIVNSLEGEEIFALILMGSEHEGSSTYFSLIVQKCQGTGEYKRVGFLLSDEEMLGFRPEERPKEDLSTIVLI